MTGACPQCVCVWNREVLAPIGCDAGACQVRPVGRGGDAVNDARIWADVCDLAPSGLAAGSCHAEDGAAFRVCDGFDEFVGHALCGVRQAVGVGGLREGNPLTVALVVDVFGGGAAGGIGADGHDHDV
jgi:hypothetical protein